MSREHFLSKSVLDLLCAKTVDVIFPWNDVGRRTTVSLENLTSGILCVRHNNALSPLDAVATQAFRNLVDAAVYVIRKSLATKRTLYATSGEGLELWALKLLFGAYHATMATEDRDALKDIHPPDFSIFQKALEDGALARPCGLYVRGSVGPMGIRAGWMPRTTETANRVTGLRFLAGPVEFELIVDPAGLNFDDPEFLKTYLVRNARQLGMAGKILFPIPERGLSERLYRVKARTVIIWGESDRLIPPVYGPAWQAAVAGSRLVNIPEAGHMVIAEKPDAVAETIGSVA